jgi:hypothetical protein
LTSIIERNRKRLTSGARIMRGTREPALPYYVIARYEANGLELLQVSLKSGEDTLPVFSSEVVARDFLLSSALKQDDWYVRESYAGELVSLLLGLCAGVEWVRIDPLPGEQVAEANPAEIAHWESFVGYLLGSKDRLFPTPQQNLVLAAATPGNDTPFLGREGLSS